MMLTRLFTTAAFVLGVVCQADDAKELKSGLSSGASVVFTTSAVPRWSDYEGPHPGIVVNVATEKDVQVAVQYCIKHDIPFLAQNGGSGWADTFHLGKRGVLINLRALNATTLAADKNSATIGGGASVAEVMDAAYASGAQILTGNCACVGVLGAYLGGGYGNLAGLHGLGIDNALAFNVVLADGSRTTVTSKDADLWWAMRGAGPNFGIVTSAVVKAYPVAPAQQLAWQGPLFFAPEKIETLIEAINDLALEPKMVLFLYYATSGAPEFTPSIIANLFYYGTEADGKAAFKSIYDVGPVADMTSVIAYNHWSDAAESFCIRGGRKPSYGAAYTKMVPSVWREIWNEFVAFTKNPGTGSSVILVEDYPPAKIRAQPDSSASFALRRFEYNSVVIPWYDDPKLDDKANAFGLKVRGLLQATDGVSGNYSYINFAHGDEKLSEVYGGSVARLKKIKKAYDPKGRFNQWFPLSKPETGNYEVKKTRGIHTELR